jgi:hypothetical protein
MRRSSIGSVNAALVSIYFSIAWGGQAYAALTSPFMGLDDPAHWTAAAYFRDWLELRAGELMAAGRVLAGVKLAVAASFAAFLMLFAGGMIVGREPTREIIETVLTLAVIGILIFAVPALADGDAGLTRLYATELLMVIGAAIVLIVEPDEHEQKAPLVDGSGKPQAMARSFVD